MLGFKYCAMDFIVNYQLFSPFFLKREDHFVEYVNIAAGYIVQLAFQEHFP